MESSSKPGERDYSRYLPARDPSHLLVNSASDPHPAQSIFNINSASQASGCTLGLFCLSVSVGLGIPSF
jgi:hypothetical protein